MHVQRIAVVFLILALMLQSFSKMVVVADFYANQDYIVKNLCINRYQRAISCGGTCQLNNVSGRRIKRLARPVANRTIGSRYCLRVASTLLVSILVPPGSAGTIPLYLTTALSISLLLFFIPLAGSWFLCDRYRISNFNQQLCNLF